MKLHQLRSFIALADAGSVRAAAKELGLTQPAVTAHIAELEQALGATLVQRTPYGTTMTSVGLALLAHARQIENQVRRAEEEVALLSNRGIGSLSIGVSPLAAIELIGPVLETFRESYPNVQLHIVEGLFLKVAAALREGAVDFVIAPIPLARRSQKVFHFEELVAYPSYVVGRSTHPLRNARRLADLIDARWVAGARTSVRESSVEELFSEYGLPKPIIAVHADSIIQVQAAISSSDVLGLLPQQLFAGWPALDIQALPIRDAIRPVRIGLITRSGDTLSPIASLFAMLVRQRGEKIARSLASRRRVR